MSYQVEGRGSFPLNMLRYDRACAVAYGAPGGEIGGTLARRTVAIEGAYGCTPERWRSFGWTVLGPVIEERVQ